MKALNLKTYLLASSSTNIYTTANVPSSTNFYPLLPSSPTKMCYSSPKTLLASSPTIASSSTKWLRGVLFLLAIATSLQFAKAQDPVLSQYFVSPIMLNPAYTGIVKEGDIRAVSQYRGQWTNVVDKLATLTLAVDMPFKRWGFGGYFVNYSAPRGLGFTNVVGSASYDITNPKQAKHKVNMGLQLGFIYQYLNPEKFVWDQQYDDNSGSFDTDKPSGETVNKMGFVMPETNYGISYTHIDHKHTFRPYAGFTLMHFLNPKQSFFADKNSKLPLRYVVNVGAKYLASELVTIEPRILYTYQRKAMQLNVGAEGSYVIKPNQLNALLGVYWRWRDAIVPTLGVEYKGILFRIAYDINTSALKQFTKGRGATEFSLVFTGNRLLKGKKGFGGNSRTR